MRAARRLPQPIEGKTATMYVIKCFSVMTEEDRYNEGCIPNTGKNWGFVMKAPSKADEKGLAGKAIRA